MTGTPIRQEYLEKAIAWIADKQNLDTIEEYMAIHQHDHDANELWLYFNSVINWVKVTFPKIRKEMKNVDWGWLYNRYGDKTYNADEFEQKILELICDDDVTKLSGIYPYLFTKEEKYLSLRAFDKNTKRRVYEKQKGKCKICKKQFNLDDMEADHITPWCEGGHTVEKNCQMLCKSCNRHKSNN